MPRIAPDLGARGAPRRSKQVLKTWLDERSPQWRDQIESVVMDDNTGFVTATTDELPGAGETLDNSCSHAQQRHHRYLGRLGDPIYSGRRTLDTECNLLTEHQWGRVAAVMDNDDEVGLEVTRADYQRLASAYLDSDCKAHETSLADRSCHCVQTSPSPATPTSRWPPPRSL